MPLAQGSATYEAFSSHVLELLALGQPLNDILHATVEGIESLHPETLCSILLLDPSRQRLSEIIGPSLPAFYNAAIRDLRIGPGIGSCGTAAWSGNRAIAEDIGQHPHWAAFRDLAREAGLGACWSQPIHAAAGEVLGTFAIYHRQPHSPDDSDIALIERAAQLASIALNRHRTDLQLREREALFRRLTEDISEVVWRLDESLRVTYISPADQRLRGFPPSAVVGHSFLEMVADTGLGPASRALDQARCDITLPMRCRDGSTLWFDVSTTRELSPGGACIGYHGVSREATGRRQAEAALKAEQQFVQAVLDSVASQIAVIDRDGMIIGINRAWRQFAIDNGVHANEAAANTDIGTNYFDICNADQSMDFPDGIAARTGIDAVLSGRLPCFSLEYPCHSPTEQRWFVMTVTPLGGDRRGAVIAHSDITARKLAEEKIRTLAYYDPLTALPNRRLLDDRLDSAMARARRHPAYGAVMLLDLDNFKPLNDIHGHAVGDLLLAEVAQRLRQNVRDSDTVARLGGDEFVVLINDLGTEAGAAEDQAGTIAEKLRLILSQPYHLQPDLLQAGPTIEHRCSASIGIALFTGDSHSADAVMRAADGAMYRAKAAGRNGIELASQTPY